MESIREKDLPDLFITKLERQNIQNQRLKRHRQIADEAIGELALNIIFGLGGGICKVCGEAKFHLTNDTCQDCIRTICL